MPDRLTPARLRDRFTRAVAAYGVWGVVVNRAYVHAPWLPKLFELWRWRSDDCPPAADDGRAGPVAPEKLRARGEHLRGPKPQLDHLLADQPQDAPPRIVVAAFDGDQLLGATWLTQRSDGSWLSHDTFVLAQARRAGVGVSLICAVQRVALARTPPGEVATICGEVLPHNKGSRAMLTACGWRRVGWILRHKRWKWRVGG